MDPLKNLVAHLMLDIDDYLNYLEDFGKSNVKYFNFVLNRQGILLIFLHKYYIEYSNLRQITIVLTLFNRSRLLRPSIISPFIDETFIALKEKFLKETSLIKRSGLIFLFCKIFFTDDVAIKLKLRINGEEWDVFKKFLSDIEDKESFMDIRLMIFHLFTENFFRFTIKSKRLALDFGSPDNITKETIVDSSKSREFWSQIEEEILKMEYTDIVELKQLAQIRDEVLKPFDHLLPEKISIDEALEGFKALKECINKISFENPKKSKKEIIESCRDYLNQQNQNQCTNDNMLVIDEELESDIEVTKKSKKIKEKNIKRKSERKMVLKKKENLLEQSEDDSTISKRSFGVQSQRNMLSTFVNFETELKKSYE